MMSSDCRKRVEGECHHLSSDLTRNAILLVCLLGGITIIFSLDNYSGFWTDETFQALCVKRYQDQPLGLLTFYIGHIWTKICGFSILNLRYLVSLEYTLAVGVASFYLFRLTANKILTGLSFLLGCILLKTTSFSLYNWDSGTYLFDSIAICLLVSVIRHPSISRYLLLGIMTGLMTLGRIPSAIFLPLSLIIIVLANKYREKQFNSWKAVILVFGGWLACIVAMTWLICGSLPDYINLFRESHTISGHSPFKDWKYLINRFDAILQYTAQKCLPSIGCLLLAEILPKIKARRTRIIIQVLWIGFCCCLVAGLTRRDFSFLNFLGGDILIGMGFLLVYPIYLLYTKTQRNRLLIIQLWAVFFLYISMAFGSDAYMERMVAGFSIPVTTAILWQTGYPTIRAYIRHFYFLTLLTFTAIFATQATMTIRAFHSDESEYSLEPFQGIKANPSGQDYLLKFSKAIPYLQKSGTRFAVMGDHIGLELVYGPHDGLPFYEFHEKLNETDGWKIYGDYYLQNVDAFVYPSSEEWIAPEIIEDIKEHGFTDSLIMGDAIILYRTGYRKGEK